MSTRGKKPQAAQRRGRGPVLRRALDLAGFLAEPQRAFLGGDSFVFYNLDTMCGWRVWGRPTRDEARQLMACIATAYAPGAPPYHSLVELRGLESVDAAGFEVLLDFVKSKGAPGGGPARGAAGGALVGLLRAARAAPPGAGLLRGEGGPGGGPVEQR